MQKIQRLVDTIDEEIEGARHYAECYIEYKVKGSANWANRFKEMAMDELKHSTFIHDLAMEEIEELNTVFKPTVEMQEVWDKSHKKYVERVAWIKQMLAM